MPSLLLGPLLRHVGVSAATLWVEVDAACTVTVRAGARDVRTPTFAVFGHHYALAVVDGLAPGSTTPYTIELDGEPAWPPVDSPFPPSAIRTLPERGSGAASGTHPVRVLFGSCRATAPHAPPYDLPPGRDPRRRGVDSLRAHGLRMLRQDPSEWPHLLALLGDQVYADEPSPAAARRMRRHRRRSRRADAAADAPPDVAADAPPDVAADAPPDVAAGFEEYTWLYREAWTPEVERWVLSVVPTTMIFDDHDMIDDWNISQSWVDDIRREAWWRDHVVGALVSYWVYQHLGNLAPARLEAEGMLARAVELGDAGEYLTRWALASEEHTPVPGGYPFSFVRHLGDALLVVVDSRNGRVLQPTRRQMVDDDEWAWIVEQCADERPRHLLIATSLPVFVPGGLHGVQQWSEVVCDGRWGRVAARAGERLRRVLDLEDWPAFDRSFRALVELLRDVVGRDDPPATVTILSGDIHFSYVAAVRLDGRPEARVHQVVCSPIRNALQPWYRAGMRFGFGRVGSRLGRLLERRAGRPLHAATWHIVDGPVFDNAMGQLDFDGDRARLRIERASLGADGKPDLEVTVDRRLDAAGAGAYDQSSPNSRGRSSSSAVGASTRPASVARTAEPSEATASTRRAPATSARATFTIRPASAIVRPWSSRSRSTS
jgi:hypothetical protein